MDRGMRPKINMPPAVKDRPAQLRHRVGFGDVHRRQRSGPTNGFDAIVQFLQRANGFGDGDDVVGRGEGFGKCCPKATRCTGDESDFCHGRGDGVVGDGRQGWRGYSAAFNLNPFSI